MCYDKMSGAHLYTKPEERNKEHDKIASRLDGQEHEIMIPPIGNGMAPKNPFASRAQAGLMHTHPDILGPEKLKEWDAATKGKHLPKHVKKG
jgi:hypothetical protein